MRVISKVFVGALAFAFVVLLACESCGAQDAPLKPDVPQQTGGRDGFRLPKLFDFGAYKSIFKKSYKSLIEGLMRQKLYWARAFRVWLSAIKYKHGAESYYLKVNHMSDWTEDELDATRMSLGRKRKSSTGPAPDAGADIEEIEAQLREAHKHKLEEGFKEIAQELEASTQGQSQSYSRRRRRDTSGLDEDPAVEHSSFSFELLVGQPDDGKESPEVAKKIKQFVPSNNAAYEPPEVASFGAEDTSGTREKRAKVGRDYMEQVVQRRKNTKLMAEVGETAVRVAHGKRRRSARIAAKNKDQNFMYIDHRESNCFFRPRDQGDCGSCYTFATVALNEYLNCMHTGELVAFSEQYMVDCGGLANLSGCDGGFLDDATRWSIDYGLELRSRYPYKERVYDCPYPKRTKKKKMGYLRPAATEVVGIENVDEYEQHLEHTPMVIGISTAGDFYEYGGGVHSGKKCKDEADHAVLLVGKGHEDGQDYWLIRNSHSVTFGEGGYYKLAVDSACIYMGAWFYKAGDELYEFAPERNPKNDNSIIDDAYEAYKEQRRSFEES